MNPYIIPVLNTLSGGTLLVKLQSSAAGIAPLECDSDVNCGSADLGAECVGNFFNEQNPQPCGPGSGICSGATAQFFVQGTSQLNPPASCTLIVNGATASDCDQGVEFVEACTEGAIWQLGCIGSFGCDGSDNIQVQCDGTSGVISDSCGFVALKG